MTKKTRTLNLSAGPSLSRSALVPSPTASFIFTSKPLASISAPRQNTPCQAQAKREFSHLYKNKQPALFAPLRPSLPCMARTEARGKDSFSALYMRSIDDLRWHLDQSDVPPVPPTIRARRERPVSLTYPAPSFTLVLAADRPVLISSRLVKAP